MMQEKNYYCYWILSGQCSYIGATVDPKRRLRQHCGVITGGARRTRGKLWTFHCVMSGFRTWREALCMEWCFKYYSRKCRSVESRQIVLDNIFKMERWTSNSPPAVDVPLKVEYDPTCYGHPPDQLPSPKPYKFKTRTKSKFKKKLHGVRY